MEEQLRGINERMRRIDRIRLRIIERTVGDLNILPGQHFVLMHLSKEGSAASQAQVANMLHVSPARVTLLMKGLDAEGYIERASGTDGRRNEITITEKGKAVVKRSRAFFKKLDEASYAGFTEEELEQFSGYLDRVLENLANIKEETGRGEEA